VFAPATVGNVGPGFDVLGLAVDGVGDTVTVELTDDSRGVTVTGRDSHLVPTDPAQNAASIAAEAVLRRVGVQSALKISIHKGLAVSGGLGGSAASSTGGAVAAALALGWAAAPTQLAQAALEGESAVAGRHLDNIAACLLGGLALVRSIDPVDIVPLPVACNWWVALVTPNIRLETRAARALLPQQADRALWIQQMANTAGVIGAFASGDADLLKRSLVDLYAEPKRESLIPRFREVKEAALRTGAYGCSISGAGPTVFAISPDQKTATACARAMQSAFVEIQSSSHVGAISRQGARAV
jgi:homoserine kinase